jgi:hypothetical protein
MAITSTSGSLSYNRSESSTIKNEVTILFEWSLDSQKGMNTTIAWTLSATKSQNYSARPEAYSSQQAAQAYLTINGTKTAYPFPTMGYFDTKVQITSGTFTITRNSETNIGDFNIQLYAVGTVRKAKSNNPSNVYYDTYPTSNQYAANSSTWYVATTTTSGVGAMILSAPDFTDEETPTITYSYDKGSSVTSAVVEAAISFNGTTDDIKYRVVPAVAEGSYTFEFTEAEKATLWTLLQNGTTALVRFWLKTTETIGEEILVCPLNSAAKTLTFVNYKPTLSPTIVDTNPATLAVTGNPNALVRYMSTAQFDIGAQPRKGGLDIISQYIQNGGRIIENIPSGVFDNVTDNTFYFSATDDRGYTGTHSITLSEFYGDFINYVKLTNKATPAVITGEGNLEVTITGKFFNYSFGAKQNQISLQYLILEDGQETGSFSDPIIFRPSVSSDYTYTHTFTITGLDYTKQYNITVRVNDLLMSQDSSFIAVSIPVFDWGKEDFRFNVPVTVDGNLTVTGDITINGVSLLQILWEGGLIT